MNKSYRKMGDNKIDSEIIRLNVGGKYFCTSRSTLLKQQESIFHQLLAEKAHHKDDKGSYYFIDRDSSMFRCILNFLRDPNDFHLPSNFAEVQQLINEARYYNLTSLINKLSELNFVEIIETCHPEKIGVCSARVVLSEDLREKDPFKDMLESLDRDHDEYHGVCGRSWVRVEMTRLDLGIKLKQHGWYLESVTSLNRKLPDITGQGTDLCHIVEKWSLS